MVPLISKENMLDLLSKSLPLDPNKLIPNRARKRPAQLSGTGRIGAVLLLLYVDDRNLTQQVVLTKRQSDMKHHAGQISLPGGKQEPGETLQQTALREAEEEIGVPGRFVSVIGKLNSIYIPPSDYTITPFVGWCESAIDFVESNQEVAEVIFVSLKTLCHPDTLQFGTIHSEPGGLEASFFQIDQHQVWGATATVLNDFIQRMNA